LLVARYREELRRHDDRHEAMAEALHRAGPAIIASAGTVIVGMLCLVFADMNSTQGLGPVAAVGIVVGLLVMMTLLPALLVMMGRWVFWPRIPHEGSAEPTAAGIWAKVGSRIARRPRAVWVVTSVLLGASSLGVVQLDANGLSTDELFTEPVQSVTGERVLGEHFPAGASDPALIVAKSDAADQVAQAAQVEGVSEVGQPIIAGDRALITATTSVEPLSQAGFDVIERLRSAVHEVEGADALVGGNAAIQSDSQEASARDAKVLIPIILIAVLVILMLLLRAIVAPVLLIATVVLSFGAALGLSALVFRHVFGWAGADASLPLFVFVFLVALGIDYNIFLMTRVREEAVRFGTRRGALIGLAATGGVITSAGLVLAGTFAVLGTLPVVSFAEIGFAVALGVLLDTLVVRSVLVTGLNLDIGRHMWWPSKLGSKKDIERNAVREDDHELADRPI
nr:MMPL family transporter [Nocardioidaceae bacterium]